MDTHPLYVAALKHWCSTLGLDPVVVSQWISGERAVPGPLADLMERELGVSRDSFRTQPYKPLTPLPKAPRVKPQPIAWGGAEAGRLGGLAKARKNGSSMNRVYKKLDELGWSVKDLAEHVGAHMKRKVSKTSMHFWVNGKRQAGKPGAYYEAPSHAPDEIKAAAKAVTGGILLESDWP